MTDSGKGKGRAGDTNRPRRANYAALKDTDAVLTQELAERIHHGELTYSEGEAQLVRAKAGPQYQNLARAEREAPATLHTALTHVDEQDEAQRQQTRNDAEERQAAYAAQRKAHSEGWFKSEATRPAQATAKPKGMTPN